MPLFESSLGAVTTPGPHIIDIAPPRTIEGVAQGRVGILMQSEWGPNKIAVEPLNQGDFIKTYFPDGTARTSTGWLATTKRMKTPWTPVRIMGSGAVKASCVIAGAYGNITATAACEGTLPHGGNMTLVIGDASGHPNDGSYKKITVTLAATSTTGSTVEVYDNLAIGDTPVSAGVMSTGAKSYLLYSLAIDSAMGYWPANGSYNFSGGNNGAAVTASDYNDGLTALAALDNIFVVVADDCGDSIRTAVNAYIATHVTSKTDRFGILTAKKTDSWASCIGSSGNGVGVNRHKWLRYATWVNVRGIDGLEYATPLAPFIASIMANLNPEEPDAWWDDKVTEYLSLGRISSLYTTVWNPQDETIQSQATQSGVCIPIKLENGRYALLHDRTTSLTVAQRFVMTQKIRRFFAKSLKTGLAPWTNGPNTIQTRRAAKLAVEQFMANQARLGRVAIADETTTTDYPQWSVGQPMFTVDITTPNTAGGYAAGVFNIALTAVTPSVMEQVNVLFSVGTTVAAS